ncbi:ketopantoate reductase family protein [Thauera sinica]|uniref:2-dehydropantoate 2-reductase n=1 Tax=Thauera sinica TaxID=2665146 RepID=A0ABW1ASK8_9RHOO|nr:2-dehydropantoate 2-reductase [Thauera sp. K11]ATE62195.1 2-dehydropantoate 2-reductase [Thauera sp. K11]
MNRLPSSAASASPPRAAAQTRFPLAIVGAGALGLHFAARLARGGPVAVVARTAQRAAQLRAGIYVGDMLYRAEAHGPDALPEAEWVIVLVKAADTADAARLAAAMRPRGVLSLQNGLTEDVLRAHCGGAGGVALVAQGITTEGAFRDGDRVTPSGAGETLVPPGFEAVAGLLSRAGFRARVEPGIAAARLAKLLVNLAINPLAALFRVPNGALLDPPFRACLDALVDEAWPLLRAEGLALDEAAAHARVAEVARATGTNRASMLQDVLAGRRTEIDAITGMLLAMAARRGVAVPVHQAVFTLVKLLERG